MGQEVNSRQEPAYKVFRDKLAVRGLPWAYLPDSVRMAFAYGDNAGSEVWHQTPQTPIPLLMPFSAPGDDFVLPPWKWPSSGRWSPPDAGYIPTQFERDLLQTIQETVEEIRKEVQGKRRLLVGLRRDGPDRATVPVRLPRAELPLRWMLGDGYAPHPAYPPMIVAPFRDPVVDRAGEAIRGYATSKRGAHTWAVWEALIVNPYYWDGDLAPEIDHITPWLEAVWGWRVDNDGDDQVVWLDQLKNSPAYRGKRLREMVRGEGRIAREIVDAARPVVCDRVDLRQARCLVLEESKLSFPLPTLPDEDRM